jgi:hypothetical protein
MIFVTSIDKNERGVWSLKWKIGVIVVFPVLSLLVGFVILMNMNKKSFRGEWTYHSGDQGCPSSLRFVVDNQMTIKNAAGMEISGTLQKAEDNKYLVKRGLTTVIIELEKLENGLLYMKEGDHTCKYEHVPFGLEIIPSP